MDSVNMPKVPPVMIAAALGWIATQAVAFGWLSSTPNQTVLSASATLLAVGISWAEAHLRGKRVTALGNVKAAGKVANVATPVVTTTTSGENQT